jgi:hypothetical protein
MGVTRFLLDTNMAGHYLNRRHGVFDRARIEVAKGNPIGIGEGRKPYQENGPADHAGLDTWKVPGSPYCRLGPAIRSPRCWRA